MSPAHSMYGGQVPGYPQPGFVPQYYQGGPVPQGYPQAQHFMPRQEEFLTTPSLKVQIKIINGQNFVEIQTIRSNLQKIFILLKLSLCYII